MSDWIGVAVLIGGSLTVIVAFCLSIDTTPTPGSENVPDRDRGGRP